MDSFPYESGTWLILGALDVDVIDGAIRPRRLPRAVDERIPTEFMRAMAYAAAGVRVRFTTASTDVGIRLRVRPIWFMGLPARLPSIVSLVIDGREVASAVVEGSPAVIDGISDHLTISTSPMTDVVFADLPPGMKTVDLWMPHGAIVDIDSVLADDEITPPAQPMGSRWIHHGSSISHGFEAPSPTSRWPARVALSERFELTDFSFAGNAMLDPFVARMIRDAPADLVSLELGINLVNAGSMTLRTFAPAVHGFLDTIRDGHPRTPLVIISPLACPVVEDAPGPTEFDPVTQSFVRSTSSRLTPDALTLKRIRQALESLVSARARFGDNIRIIDGISLMGLSESSELLVDGLHPGANGHERIAERARGPLVAALDT